VRPSAGANASRTDGANEALPNKKQARGGGRRFVHGGRRRRWATQTDEACSDKPFAPSFRGATEGGEPGMTSVSKLDTSTPRALTQAELSAFSDRCVARSWRFEITTCPQLIEPLAFNFAGSSRNVDTRRIRVYGQSIARVGFSKPQRLQLPSIELDAQSLRKQAFPCLPSIC